jgi:adenosylmethionine-8-amino-7-oxononanoate aminotransferase
MKHAGFYPSVDEARDAAFAAVSGHQSGRSVFLVPERMAVPENLDVVRFPATYAYRCEESGGDLTECGKHCISELKTLLAKKGKTVAGLLFEPLVQVTGGVILQPPGHLSKLRELCDAHDILLICDESATAPGRVGRKLWATLSEGITPDILISGTCFSDGIGILLGNGKTGEFSGPGTDPTSCRRAIATLDRMEEEDVLEKVRTPIHFLGNELTVMYTLPWIGEVRMRGLFVGLELVESEETGKPFPPELKVGERVVREAKERGILLTSSGDTVIMMLSFTVTEEEIGEFLSTIRDAIQEVCSKL